MRSEQVAETKSEWVAGLNRNPQARAPCLRIPTIAGTHTDAMAGTKSGLWHETEEVSFYACQAALPAAKIGAAIREHWGIESAPQAHTRRRFRMNELTDCV